MIFYYLLVFIYGTSKKMCLIFLIIIYKIWNNFFKYGCHHIYQQNEYK